MSRRRGKMISGWIAVDKPAGITSAQTVAAVKRLIQPQKIGHAGTLDPMATGVLPLALGEATKTIPFIVDREKEYEFSIRWGEATDTDDADGEVIGRADRWPTAKEIDAALPAFIGEIQQVPPRYSAVKVKGRRAYELARGGEQPELSARPVEIFGFIHLPDKSEKQAVSQFRVTCGKGTYVRSLARDLARELGTCGHVATIRRTRVGPFTEEQCFSLEKLNQLSHSARHLEAILPVAAALDDIPALAVTRGEADRARHGQVLKLPTTRSGTVCLKSDGQLVALAQAEDGTVRPIRVFQHLEGEKDVDYA